MALELKLNGARPGGSQSAVCNLSTTLLYGVETQNAGRRNVSINQ